MTNAKSQEEQSTSEQINQDQNNPDNSRSQKAAAGFPKHAAAIADSRSAAKFESDDTTTASETNTNIMMKKKKSFSKKVASGAGRSSGGSNNNVENPVENIRKQLKKLEDLGDQLPSNETAYTVRYPFQDKGDYLKSIPRIVTRPIYFSRQYNKFCSHKVPKGLNQITNRGQLADEKQRFLLFLFIMVIYNFVEKRETTIYSSQYAEYIRNVSSFFL